jgi:hypothetical protein
VNYLKLDVRNARFAKERNGKNVTALFDRQVEHIQVRHFRLTGLESLRLFARS